MAQWTWKSCVFDNHTQVIIHKNFIVVQSVTCQKSVFWPHFYKENLKTKIISNIKMKCNKNQKGNHRFRQIAIIQYSLWAPFRIQIDILFDYLIFQRKHLSILFITFVLKRNLAYQRQYCNKALGHLGLNIFPIKCYTIEFENFDSP